MKFSKVLGAAVVASVALLSATSVYAADKVSFGQVYDLTEGKYTSDLVNDHLIAVPFDITSDVGTVTVYEIIADYDSDVLTAGGSTSGALKAGSVERDNVKALAGTSNWADHVITANDDSTIRTAIVSQMVFDADSEVDVFAGKNSYVSNSAYESNAMSLAYSVTASTDVTQPIDGYLLFTVKDASKAGLNKELVSVNTTKTLYSDGIKAHTVTSVTAETEAKANACAGAFKVSIDSATVPKYVHALYVSFDDGATKQDIADYVVTGSVYDFPVRVLSTKSETSVTAKIYADLGTTESKVDETVEIGTVTVDLTGTATDYSTSATTNIK